MDTETNLHGEISIVCLNIGYRQVISKFDSTSCLCIISNEFRRFFSKVLYKITEFLQPSCLYFFLSLSICYACVSKISRHVGGVIASRFPVEWRYTKVLIFPEGIQIQPISNAFLPAFFPYKFHINNDDIHWVLPQRPGGHSYHIYTYGLLIY